MIETISVGVGSVGGLTVRGGDGSTLTMGIIRSSNPSTISAITATDIGGHRAVSLDSTGLLVLADSSLISTLPVLGITLAATVAGARAIVHDNGTVTDPFWQWVPSRPIYVSTNGTLTQIPPQSGYIQMVAIALTSDTIALGLHSPIII